MDACVYKRVMTTAVQLVVKKFEDQVGGDVNYPAFIQAIDVEYTGQTMYANKCVMTTAIQLLDDGMQEFL